MGNEVTVMFKQIKVRHISEEVFDQIKSAILEGKLKPGEKLPAEREMMKELGVSRIPIREALKLLAIFLYKVLFGIVVSSLSA